MPSPTSTSTAAADPTGGVVLPWPDHLDALEEWLRRTRDVVEGGTEDAPGPLASTPEGPLPEALRLRATVALTELERLQEAGLARRRGLARGQAYQQF